MMPYFPKKVENVMVQIGLSQRSYQRWLDKRTCKMEMEKNLPTAMSMQLFGAFFSASVGKKVF